MLDISRSPASLAQASSSDGRMNLLYSCVPAGNSFSTYSAPTMAKTKDFGLRLIVEKNTSPPGLTSVRHERMTS